MYFIGYIHIAQHYCTLFLLWAPQLLRSALCYFEELNLLLYLPTGAVLPDKLLCLPYAGISLPSAWLKDVHAKGHQAVFAVAICSCLSSAAAPKTLHKPPEGRWGGGRGQGILPGCSVASLSGGGLFKQQRWPETERAPGSVCCCHLQLPE